ncbi:sulfite exporter TauE/SafE family protein [Saprospiraceae bacterium]|nr:sulfite exporter TauE/SafE family protein [Saprospiraceae bacterium]
MKKPKNSKPGYYRYVVALLLVWILVITHNSAWYLLTELWEIPLVMSFGSFVAGFSAEGGGAVAFPIFTKVLDINPSDAKQFSLLIQSVGMTMASFYIITRKISFYKFAIIPAVLGGALGQFISLQMGWFMASHNLKWLFTIIIAALGIALILQHFSGIKRFEEINTKTATPLLFFTGLLGGFLTINVGCGADMIAFIMLTLILNSTEKKATPTTVIIMAVNSIVGVLLITYMHSWSPWAIDAWKTSIPVVIFGAPLGALLASKVSNSVILKGLLLFILIEVLSTIWLVPIQNWVIPVFIGILITMCSIVWWKYKNKSGPNLV